MSAAGLTVEYQRNERVLGALRVTEKLLTARSWQRRRPSGSTAAVAVALSVAAVAAGGAARASGPEQLSAA